MRGSSRITVVWRVPIQLLVWRFGRTLPRQLGQFRVADPVTVSFSLHFPLAIARHSGFAGEYMACGMCLYVFGGFGLSQKKSRDSTCSGSG